MESGILWSFGTQNLKFSDQKFLKFNYHCQTRRNAIFWELRGCVELRKFGHFVSKKK